ncbi:YhgE/Pip domain-containing protein [Latilactobacillus fuchuensis]|uniref:YhgE Pip N-terminal domain protein n=1 Tax=Latilactobacillus fuchuensis DSM 14340 = JCM 11249 TaxID=1423747 RepID=A0A0R1RUM6_9LACO|nr:YhgE/Pip domain-containing protein [Latilactobacillus fuchuensis]KRL60832.1 yhgE Pip N-terminal domain protein [Latilactobacillus fuchuensis DSM 14340 = JCM 11249]
MFSSLKSNRGRLIAFITLICLIPILLLFIIFNFVKHAQNSTTQNLNVAVINQDQAATFRGKKVDVGQEVQAQLSKDHQVHWQFVSAKEAKANLKNGHYVMAVTLPKGFSKNVTTVLDKKPQASTMQVATSQKNNYLTGVITNQVTEKMQTQIIKSIQIAYDQALLKAIGTLGSGVTEASQGVDQLDTAADQLSSGSQQIATNLVKLQAGTQQLATSVTALPTGVQQLTTGSGQLATGLQQLADQTQPLQSGVQQLATGSTQLNAGISQYTAGVSTLDGGLHQLTANNTSIMAGSQSLNGGVDQLASGSQQLSTKLAEASAKIDASLSGSEPQMNQLKAGLQALNASIQTLNQKVSGGSTSSTTIENDLLKIADNTKQTGVLLQDSGSQLSQINDKVYNAAKSDSVASQVASAGTQLKALQKLATSNTDFLVFLLGHPDVMSQLQSISTAAGTNLTAAGAQLQSSGANMQTLQTNIGTMGAKMTDNGTQLTEVSTELKTTADSMVQLQQAIAQMASKDQAPAALAGAVQAIDQLTAGLAEVNTGLKQQGTTTDTMGGLQATNAIHEGLVKLQTGLQGKNGLVTGLQTYTDGVATAQAGSQQLAANNQTLNSGAGQLNTGLSTLNQQTPQLTSGVQQLNTGASQLNTGLNTLNQQTPTLLAGVNQINDGTGQLATGATQLDSGMHQAGAGIALLDVKLADGSQQVKNLATGTQNVNHLMQPVKTQLTTKSALEQLINVYGPLILTLIFFVGALLTQSTLYRQTENLTSGKLRKRILTVTGVIAVQGILIASVAKLLGLEVAQPMAFIVLSLLIAATFTLACLALDRLFGTLGVLVGFALVFVQLIMIAGPFQSQLLSITYRFVAFFLPGTYAVNGLEQVINGTGQHLVGSLFALIIFCGIFFMGLFGQEVKNHLLPTANSQA